MHTIKHKFFFVALQMSSTEESENRSAEKQSVPIGSTSLSINISFVKSLLGIFQGVVIVGCFCLILCTSSYKHQLAFNSYPSHVIKCIAKWCLFSH